MNLRFALVLALAGTCGVALPGLAAEPLRLHEAVSRALASNPSLTAETQELRATEARARREALPTPYTVGGEVENFGGTGSLSGVGSSETTLRIGRVLELGGKRAAREALGAAEVTRQQNRADVARIEIASRTATRFIDVVSDQERLAFAKRRLELAERTRREVASWVNAARNPDSDLRAAEIAVAEAELEVENVQHELLTAKMALASSWGALTPDFESVQGDFDALPPVEEFEDLVTRLPMTPEQRSAILDAEAIVARRRVAEASAKPDVNVSLGVRRMEGLDDQGLVMAVTVPLGSRKRASFSIAEADAQLAAVEARRQAQQYERHQELFARYQELGHARHEVEVLKTSMIPKAEQALATTRRGFEEGRFAFFVFAQAQGTLFDLLARSVEATARYHALLVEIERLTAAAQDTTP